ncbi:MAG: hypothetical protein AAB262_05460, partial [Elusimicrobiota bacterium]
AAARVAATQHVPYLDGLPPETQQSTVAVLAGRTFAAGDTVSEHPDLEGKMPISLPEHLQRKK